jgi:glycosyltransferase involved in cell wall biosynthesis
MEVDGKSAGPIRVLMLFTIMNRGGAETMVMTYFRKMDRSRVMFDFLVRRRERGAYEDEIESLGGRVWRLPMFNPAAVADFFDRHPEYTMVHGHCSELGYFVYREAHRRGFRFVAAHAHNSPRGWDIKTPVRGVLKRAMRPHLTHCFTCGDEAARWLFGARLSREAIFLPNAVDTGTLVCDPAARDEVRRLHGWDGRFVVGNVGRFSSQKNHLFLIDVFAHIVRLEPSALLALVGGGGEMERRVRERVRIRGLADNVVFMGSRSDVAKLLQGMDVFVFPSKFEGLSVAMLEAQAAGIKVVNSTAIPRQGTIVPELVESIPPRLGPAVWAERILRATAGHTPRDRRAEIREAGFDIDTNAQWLQDLYLTAGRH